ncbi:spore coat protein [Sorangium cellulosum]|uniref:Spore coat protein n=1 Tax=Sorangium cellulosum TaxID=56 RepID=A0A4P2PVR8_SORCE|nr:spore coat protein [Sorangium cellulosum]
MANLIHRREREPGSLSRGWDPLRTDPFQMMRDLLRWGPFREMESLGGWAERAFTPEIELKETKDAFVICADLPGVDEKDLEISVTGNRIQISGKREEEERREDDRYFAYERSYGSFCRAFTLPEGANADEVTAELKNGVLSVRVPKRPEVQARRITVQPAGKQLEESKGKEKRTA